MNSFGVEKATTTRVPSTANLMVDSADRNTVLYPSAFDFQITKNQQLINGYFTRVGLTEMVLEWCEPNITIADNLNEFEIDISGSGANTFSGTAARDIPQGNYTIASCIDAIINQVNDLSGSTGFHLSFEYNTVLPGQWALVGTGGVFHIGPPANPPARWLGSRLGLAFVVSVNNPTFGDMYPYVYLNCPDLRPYRYIDFVSEELTYNQDVKDAMTQDFVRDVLTRWYFAYADVPYNLDKYGYPILMGYEQGTFRRLFNPPKQIQWNPIQPVGNLTFKVYDEDGNLLPTSDDFTEWLMTLQLSEN